MRRLFLLFFLMLPCGALAESKRDLRGFSPGMTKSEVNGLAGTLGCSLEKECKVEDGSLSLTFTKHLEPPLLYKVFYKFKSSARAEDMVPQISKQFGKRPVDTPAKVKRSISSAVAPHQETLPFSGNPYWTFGGHITSWALEGGLELWLDMEPGGTSNDYKLFLSDPGVDKKDSKAWDDEQKAKWQNVNPVPKL